MYLVPRGNDVLFVTAADAAAIFVLLILLNHDRGVRLGGAAAEWVLDALCGRLACCFSSILRKVSPPEELGGARAELGLYAQHRVDDVAELLRERGRQRVVGRAGDVQLQRLHRVCIKGRFECAELVGNTPQRPDVDLLGVDAPLLALGSVVHGCAAWRRTRALPDVLSVWLQMPCEPCMCVHVCARVFVEAMG